jgi:hypothetical protein
MGEEEAMAHFCLLLQTLDPNWSEYLLEEKRTIDEELKKEWNRQVQFTKSTGPAMGFVESVFVGPFSNQNLQPFSFLIGFCWF